MSAVMKASPQEAVANIRRHTGDIEMSCLNLQILLDSVTDKLDSFQDRLSEIDANDTVARAHFNAISCFISCAARGVADVLSSSAGVVGETCEVAA